MRGDFILDLSVEIKCKYHVFWKRECKSIDASYGPKSSEKAGASSGDLSLSYWSSDDSVPTGRDRLRDWPIRGKWGRGLECGGFPSLGSIEKSSTWLLNGEEIKATGRVSLRDWVVWGWVGPLELSRDLALVSIVELRVRLLTDGYMWSGGWLGYGLSWVRFVFMPELEYESSVVGGLYEARECW